MVGYVTMAAFVFALTFALFLAWPFIWKAATTLTFSETLGTGAANAGTGAGTSRAAKGTEAPGGWSWLEIGGLVAGIAVFIVFVVAVVVYIRRGPGETRDAKLKREREEALAGPARRFRIVTAGKAGKDATAFLGRQAGRAGQFLAKATNSELENQRRLLNKWKEEAGKITDEAEKMKVMDHINNETDKLRRNIEKWGARSNEEWENVKPYVADKDLPRAGSATPIEEGK